MPGRKDFAGHALFIKLLPKIKEFMLKVWYIRNMAGKNFVPENYEIKNDNRDSAARKLCTNFKNKGSRAMTKKLFYDDAYLKEFDAEVVAVKEKGGKLLVCLDQSAFYPEGGGQGADDGELIIVSTAAQSIGSTEKQKCESNVASEKEQQVVKEGCAENQKNIKIKVVDVHETDEEIWHTVEIDIASRKKESAGESAETPSRKSEDAGDNFENNARVLEMLTPGAQVHGIINWEKRFDHMQQHSGEHIVSGIICRMFNCDNVGFHMGEDAVTIDYNARISMEDAKKVEEEALKYIWEAHDFVQLWPSKEELKDIDYRSKKELEGAVRITSFPGADTCACCGTHVKNSAEVGLVKLVSAHNFHEGTRLELYCGKRALDFLSMNLEENKKIAVLLSTKEDKTFTVVKKQQEDFIKLKSEMNTLENSYLKKLASEWEGKENAVIISNTCSATAGRNLADLVADKVEKMAAVFTKSPEEENVYRFAICARGQDITAFVKEMNLALSGRGGGKNGFAQGTVNASANDIENYFSDKDYEIMNF